MNKKGFASIYMIYTFFVIFLLMMLTTFMVNNYKRNFLNVLKNDIKEELKEIHLEKRASTLENNQ